MKKWQYTVSKNGRHQISEVGGGNVCMVWNCKDKERNANLIAAAPEVYAEIEREIIEIEARLIFADKRTLAVNPDVAKLKRKKAILAKARGEQ